MTKMIQIGRLVLYTDLDLSSKFVDITIIPTLILVKNPYSYALEFKWLTCSFQIEYRRDNNI